MVRVLHVFGGLGTGGTESLIMNWYRNIDRSRIQFDFLVRSSDNNYVKEIEEMGGRVFYTSSFPRHFIKNYLETNKILKQKEWDVIHVHGNAAMYLLPLKLAKKFGYRVRIMHSHNIKSQRSLYSIVHRLNQIKIKKYTTHCLACSEAAGEWMYNNCDFKVLKNAVDVKSFLYDSKAREEIREIHRLKGKYVIGHVGRFANQKNHGFLLSVFKEINIRKPESILMLVGDGELREEVEKKVKNLDLSDAVLFLGRRTDIGKVLSSMDLFLLPSLYEGLPVACVESSTNGLCSIISEEAYTKEAKDIPNLYSYSLNNEPEKWATYIIENMERFCRKNIELRDLNDSEYNIDCVVKELCNIYIA